MKKAMIDLGSNSIRLTLYKISDDKFLPLFKKKIMAYLASYVVDKNLSDEGIKCASHALLRLMNILKTLNVTDASVFATASPRNVNNTKEALKKIEEETSLKIEVLSGEDEAMLGYKGAMIELDLENGAFINIGGASTKNRVV